ncbi:hypothetical protein E1264_01520 [Actinomadura sp. KC216]|uniref:hypothetical protein n=1 Tax=Actinomadura sp. KC216 TaxID=2530370 RepID=UPI001042CB5F|nr:hypothetical protein [Actinomadura sp. KC216]TDB91498.1 hypothetical protein E1264_01520 [Actinomadura sp. KC216]
MDAESDTNSPARVSEAAWEVTSFIAFAAFGARMLSHDGFLWYASLALTAIAAPLSAVLLVRSLQKGTESWASASVALSLVTAALIRLLV